MYLIGGVASWRSRAAGGLLRRKLGAASLRGLPGTPATPMTLAFEDILAAKERLAGHVERTPMRLSRTLSEITGAEVWVKFENLQFTAAFKERGALNKLLQLGENVRARGVIAASAGNHSQGLAYHAARLGIPVTIV